jgi:hypothetical protein
VNETKTTALFAIVAAIAVGAAWVSRPSAIRTEGELAAEKRGSVIFPGLEPDAANSFRIVRFNEDLATLNRLELSKDPKTDLWTLPSADGYPADSAEQVSQATTPLVELTVLSTVSTDRGDHVLYGVVEPNEQELTVSASGVGMLVQVGGADNEILASLIVGKPVEGVDGQHYVRVPTEDAVYVVEINANAFTTDLEKWIKGDILNVRSMDIEQVGLRDYAILRTERGYGLGRNFDADIEYKDNKWSLVQFVDHTKEDSPAIEQPPEGMSLNDQAFNDLRSSIQTLKIVNVRRKPLGLAADLKADKSLLENVESTKSLQDQGFFPMESGEVFSAGGELIVGTKDGVRYLLRFGNTRVSGAAVQSGADEEDSDEGVTRYLLVMAELDESKFPPPELRIVPESVEEMLAQEMSKDSEGSAVEYSVDETSEPENAESVKDDEPVAEDPASPLEDDAAESTGDEATAEPFVDEPGNNDVSRSVDRLERSDLSAFSASVGKLVSTLPNDQTDQPGEDQPPVESPNQPVESSEITEPSTSVSSGKQDDMPTELAPSRQETQEELQERLEYLQETIRKENQRLIDDRNEKLNEGKKKVAELNARFADWYYIVSDRIYNKLKVSRDQLFRAAGDPTPSELGPGFDFPNLPPGLQLPTE